MNATEKYAKNIERFRQAVAAHDRENPDHDPAYGIGLAYHDLDRLGMEVGEQLWSGVCVYDDGGQASNFRVLCNGEHAGEGINAGTSVQTPVEHTVNAKETSTC